MSEKKRTLTAGVDAGHHELLYINNVLTQGSKCDLILDLRLRHPDGNQLVARVYMPVSVAEDLAKELERSLTDLKEHIEEEEAQEAKMV